MTLFVKTLKQTLEIRDIYVMVISFLIFFAVSKILKSIIKKQKRNNTEDIKI